MQTQVCTGYADIGVYRNTGYTDIGVYKIYRHRCAQDMGDFFYVVILTLDELIT
jgi:hypothetical protein